MTRNELSSYGKSRKKNLDALIVTLQMDPETQEHFTRLRTRYFPPARNFLSAHITLFHALPRSNFAAIDQTLRTVTGGAHEIKIKFTALQKWNRGFAVRIESGPLLEIRAELADCFRPVLTPQDLQKFQPHLTLMNKGSEEDAAKNYAEFAAEWLPREGHGLGLDLYTYANGPWINEKSYRFVP